MKHLNFLSKSGSRSCGHSSVTLASTVGSPSAHRRGAMLRLLSVLVLMFTIGVGSVWGADELSYTITYEKGSSDSNSTEAAIDEGGDYASLGSLTKAYKRTNGMHLSSGSANGSATLTMTTAGQVVATKIITNALAKSNKSFTITVNYVGGGSENKAFTPGTTTTDCVFELTNSSKKKISTIVYSANSGSGAGIASTAVYVAASCSPITPTLSYTSTNLTIGGGNSSSPTLNKNGSTGAVTWSSDKTSVATVNSSGVVTPVGTGTCNIIASIAAAGGKCAGEVSVEFTVKRNITYYIGTTQYTVGGFDGDKLTSTLPANPSSCDGVNYPYFYGWKNGSISGSTTTAPTILSTEVVSSSTAANTYYAVFTNVEVSDYSTIYTSNVTLPSSGTNASSASVTIGSTSGISALKLGKSGGGGSATFTVPSGTTKLYLHAAGWNGKSTDFTLSTSVGSISPNTAQSLTSNSGIHDNSPFTLSTPLSNDFFEYTLSNVNNVATITIATGSERGVIWGVNATSGGGGSNAKYITTCCTSLGSINGSVSVTQTSAVVKLASAYAQAANADAYQLKVEGSSNYNTWTDVDKDYLTTSVGVTVNGLACGTDYTAYLRAKGSGTYCDYGTESHVDFTTSKYAITKINPDHGTLVVQDNATQACDGTQLTLTATPTSPYTGGTIKVIKTGSNPEEDVTSTVYNVGTGKLTMPAYGVTISATFTEPQAPSISASGEALNGTTLAFGEQEISTTSSSKTFTITGLNLAGDVTWVKGGENASMFTVTSPASSTIAQATAAEGQDITVTFTPTSAGSKNATLTFSTSGASDKVIELTGTGINLYTVTFDKGTGVCETPSAKQTTNGGSVTLPDATPSTACAAEDWEFAGWSETNVTTETETAPTILEGDTYTPTENKTLYAVYSRMAGDPAAFNNAAGQYRIYVQIGEDKYYATGTGTSISSTTDIESATIYDFEKIEENQVTYFAIKTGTTYITYANNSNNKTYLGTSTTAYNWSINTGTKGSFRVASQVSGRALSFQSYNDNGSTKKFAGYSTNNITAQGNQYFDVEIESTGSLVYHKSPSCTGTATLTYDANGGENVPDAVEYDIDDDPVVAGAGSMSLAGHTFVNWNTKANGEGTTYAAGATITDIKKDMTLYAIWTANTHKVSVSSVDHGTITATPAGASEIAEGGNNAAVAYGTVVSLVQENDTHFTFGTWSVMAGETPVAVENDQFTMPDADVTISATFTENAKRDLVFYSNGTQVGEKVTTYVGEAPATAPTAVYESCLEGSNQFYGWATEEWTGAIASTAGKMVYTGALPDVAAGEGDVAYYAVWAKGTATPSNSYAAITSDLAEDNYVIAYSYNGGTQIVLTNAKDGGTSDTQLEGEAPSLSDSKYVTTEGKYIWELQAQNDGSYYIYNAASEKYLNATTTALSMSTTQTKFTITYDETNSRWTIQLKDNDSYYMHGYVSGTSYDFRVSESGSGYKYRTYLYKNEKEISYSDFRTNCCSLKPVTGLTAGTIAATSVTLNWNAPESTDGITKLQVVNADNGNVLKDNIDKDATSAVVTGLETCTTYNLKVVSVGDDCSSNSNIVTATPQEAAKTVTFQYNDGATADLVESTTCEANYVAVPANPTRSGYRFMGWKNGDVAVEGATFTPTAATTTINATWAQLFTVYYDFAGATTGVAPDDAQYIAGEEVTLTDVEPSKGFLAPFKAWSFSPSVEVSEGKFAMPSSDVTITATYDEIVGQWILVTDESTLNEGDYVVIAAAGSNKAMKTTQNSTSYRYITDITKSGNTISTPSNDVQIFVLEEGTVADSWAFKCLNGDYKEKYIYANSNGNNNTMNSQDAKDDNGSWKLDLHNGKATAQGTNKKKVLQYNNDRFACYETASQSAIAFYQFREGIFYNINMPASAPTGGTVSANTSMAKAGETVTLTYTPSRGYTVESLTVTGATSGSIAISPALEAGVTEYTFTMPAEAVTVAASFEAVPPVVYNLVENADELAVGMQFVMVGKKASPLTYYGANEISGSFLSATELEDVIDAVNNKASITTQEVIDFVLEGEPGKYKILYEGKELNDGGNTSVSFVTSGSEWTITNVENSEAVVIQANNKFQFNPNNPRFTTYSNGGQQPIYIYALPYTTYNFVLDGCKTIKVVTGYTYTYTIKNSDEPSSKPGDNYTFLHKWTDGTNTYAVGDEVTVSAAKTLQPCWKVTTPADADINTLPTSVTEIVIKDGKTLTIGAAGRSLDNLTVEAGGKVDLSAGKALTVDNFYIEGQDYKSGQVFNAENLTINGDAYFDFTLAVSGTTAANQWHNFSVPFPVDAMSDVYGWKEGEWKKLTNEVDYAIENYIEENRAAGKYGWKKYRSVMTPGYTYSMTVNGDIQTFRFKKTSDSYTFSATPSVDFTKSSDDATNAGWNGLGNMRLCYASVSNDDIVEESGVRYVQILDANDYEYKSYPVGSINLTVGSAFFIQAASAGTMNFSTTLNNNPTITYAPARTPVKRVDEPIAITLSNESSSDRMYITASEEATNEYQIGRDLQKMFATSTPRAPMIYSVNYGGIKLAAEEAPLVNNQAVYELTLYAPANDTYSIEAAAVEEYEVYLTQNGTILWNLSMSAYEIDLNKGTTNGYGLLLQAKAPQVVTEVDEVDAETGVQKIIIDEHVFILRGGKMYDVTGKMVK